MANSKQVDSFAVKHSQINSLLCQSLLELANMGRTFSYYLGLSAIEDPFVVNIVLKDDYGIAYAFWFHDYGWANVFSVQDYSSSHFITFFYNYCVNLFHIINDFPIFSTRICFNFSTHKQIAGLIRI